MIAWLRGPVLESESLGSNISSGILWLVTIGQVTAPRILFPSPEKCRKKMVKKKKENGEEVVGCPLHTPSPFPP